MVIRKAIESVMRGVFIVLIIIHWVGIDRRPPEHLSNASAASISLQ